MDQLCSAAQSKNCSEMLFIKTIISNQIGWPNKNNCLLSETIFSTIQSFSSGWVLYLVLGRERSLRREKGERKTPPLPPPYPYIGNSGNKKIRNPGPRPGQNPKFTSPFRTFPVFGYPHFLPHLLRYLAFFEIADPENAEITKYAMRGGKKWRFRGRAKSEKGACFTDVFCKFWNTKNATSRKSPSDSSIFALKGSQNQHFQIFSDFCSQKS